MSSRTGLPPAAWVAFGAVVGLWLVAHATRDPPATLTERQKAAIQQKIATEVMHGEMLYNLPHLFPPPVKFTTRDPRNAAESTCDYYGVRSGEPTWGVGVNERLAAQNYHRFFTETIPHEVAHLMLCRISIAWETHDERWEAIVRDMGATPFPHHDYAGE